jgi:hypothetical protein
MEMYAKQHTETKTEQEENVCNAKVAKTDLMTVNSQDSSEQDTRLSCKRKHEPSSALNHFSSDDDYSDKEVNGNGVTSLRQEDNESHGSKEIDNDSDFVGKEDIDSDTSDSDDEGPDESAVRWKATLAQKAADAFLERQSTTHNLWKLVYGKHKGCTVYLPHISYLHAHNTCLMIANKTRLRDLLVSQQSILWSLLGVLHCFT